MSRSNMEKTKGIAFQPIRLKMRFLFLNYLINRPDVWQPYQLLKWSGESRKQSKLTYQR